MGTSLVVQGVIQMEKLNVLLASKTVNIAEYKNYYELIDRVCYYDEQNLNGVRLPYNDSTLEKAQTLVGMPVYAKYCVNAEGEPTFRGHEAYIDEDGEIAFDTIPIGVHMSVEIKNDNVEIGGEIKNLPCLFSSLKIWKRNKNVCAAMLRLYELGELHNSWEISSLAYSYKDGIKTLDDYIFDGNCLLGSEYAYPAYGESAKIVSLSSLKNEELMVAQALSKDILESSDKNIHGKEDKNLDKENTNPVIEDEEMTETHQDEAEKTVSESEDGSENTEVSALTERDLRLKIQTEIENKLDEWAWICYHFPIDRTVWVEVEGRESELDYVLFTYDVGESGDITLSEPTNVKLSVSVSEINNTFSERNEALVSANKTIEELNAEISELKTIEAKYNEILSEKAEMEKSQKIEQLKNYVTSSNQFTKEEIESEEIKTMISELKETELKNMIADRVVSCLKKKNEKIEISEKKAESVRVELVNSEDPKDKKSIMKDFLHS